MSRDSILRQKSKTFAKRIVMLYRYLGNEHKEFVLSKQVLRSGTSIGANIAEAIYAGSRKDFLARLHIAQKKPPKPYIGWNCCPNVDTSLKNYFGHCTRTATN